MWFAVLFKGEIFGADFETDVGCHADDEKADDPHVQPDFRGINIHTPEIEEAHHAADADTEDQGGNEFDEQIDQERGARILD